MNNIRRILKGVYFFCWGHLLALRRYDKRYLCGRWFQGKMRGICAPGWRWVVVDAKANKRMQTNLDAPFPVSSDSRVINPKNIIFDPDDLNNFQGFGNYYQAIGRITIGKGTFIAPNAGLITANHDPMNLDAHLSPKEIVLGEQCWIGMNSTILPGVRLGNHTVVGAGSVVTKSFPEGNCVIAGNPAKIIRMLDEMHQTFGMEER